jgi:hypothetical protein
VKRLKRIAMQPSLDLRPGDPPTLSDRDSGSFAYALAHAANNTSPGMAAHEPWIPRRD